MKDLSGKVALIAGAGSSGTGVGNGRAAAIALGREGTIVVCADRNLESAAETAQQIEKSGGIAEAIELEVTDESSVRKGVSYVSEKYGKIDVLNNNVGISVIGRVTEIKEAEWDHVFATNLKGAAFAMKHVIPIMIAQGGGSIINISSVTSIRWTGVSYASYYASKAALNHLTRTTAAEFAKNNIRVNVVLPGLIKTPMVVGTRDILNAYGVKDVDELWEKRDAQVPMGHMGTPWDVANAVLFLASSLSSYITGIELRVDGGLSLGFGSA